MGTRRRIVWPTVAGALFSLAIGGSFFAFGVWQVWTTNSFLSDAQDVSAVVIDSGESCDDEGCTYWPTVSVDTGAGQPQEMRTQFGSSMYETSEGQTIDVLYNPAYSYIRMPGGEELWLLGVAAIFFGGLGLLICAVAVWSGLTERIKDDD